MKKITNISLQPKTITLNSETRVVKRILIPGESIEVADSYLTSRIRIMLDRKLISVVTVS